MKHSVEELTAIAYQYFPRGVSGCDPAYEQTEEFRRRRDARARASADYGVWTGMLDLVAERFPANLNPGVMVENLCYFMQSPTAGSADRCFSGALWLPARSEGERQHNPGFLVSFVVPYYVICSNSLVLLQPAAGDRDTERRIGFQMSPDEVAFSQRLAEEIERAFPAHVPMLSEVGQVVLADIDDPREAGHVTLFDCLFTDHW